MDFQAFFDLLQRIAEARGLMDPEDEVRPFTSGVLSPSNRPLSTCHSKSAAPDLLDIDDELRPVDPLVLD